MFSYISSNRTKFAFFIMLAFILLFGKFSFADGYGWEKSLANTVLPAGNQEITSMVVFNDYLYAGTKNYSGGKIWRSSDGVNWVNVTPGAGGDYGVSHIFVFNGYIYADYGLSSGSQLWRSANGVTWATVSDGVYEEFICSAVFNNKIYVGKARDYNNDIYASTNGTSWSRVVTFGSGYGSVKSLVVFNNKIYAGIDKGSSGGEIRRSSDGVSWELCNTPGFGYLENYAISSLAIFNGYLYAGTQNEYGKGAEIWRSSNGTTWGKCRDRGFGNYNYGNGDIRSLTVFDGCIFAGTYNFLGEGCQIWRSSDGTTWKKCSNDGFGSVEFDMINSLIVFGNYIYAGTGFVLTSSSSSGEIYRHSSGGIWEENLNLAMSAAVTASSYYNGNFSPNKANDGIYGAWDEHEWASSGEMAPDINFRWSEAHTINKVVLYDRCNPIDHISDAWMYLKRGGSVVKVIHLGMFPFGGSAKEVIFDPVSVDEIFLDITDGWGLNVGLSEMQVYYDTNPGGGLVNLASLAKRIMSSSDYNLNYSAGKAIDGIYGAWDEYEWASNGEMTPSLSFDWFDGTAWGYSTINKIVLYDRCNPIDHIEDAWLNLYNYGEIVKSIHVGMFPFGGSAKEIIFDPVEVDAIELDIVDGWGLNVGLSEIQVYGDPEVQRTTNLVKYAAVTASSTYSSMFSTSMANDGIYGAWDEHEWASSGEMAPDINFKWSEAYTINKVILYDRCNPVDHISDAWMYLKKDGSVVKSIHLGMFPYGGAAKEINFDPTRVDEIYLDITDGWGLNVGLSELQVFEVE